MAVLLAALVVGIGFWLTRSTGSSKPHAAAGGLVSGMNFGVVDGMTKHQVLAVVGQPTKTRSGCWVYQMKFGKIGRHPTPFDAFKVCFLSGIVSNTYDHWQSRWQPYAPVLVPPPA